MNSNRRLLQRMQVQVFQALLLVSPLTLAQADDSLSRLVDAGVVRVADTQTAPPLSYLDENNQPDGYDVAVAKEIFKRLGVAKVEFVADKFSNFVQSLQAHKYDVVINSMANTPERAKLVDFTVPYSVEEFRIWVNEKNTDIHDVPSLAGKTVGASSGTSNELWERRNLTQSSIHTYDVGSLLYNDLALGRLDAIIDSYFAGKKMHDLNHLPVKVVGEPVAYSLGAAALPKGSAALRHGMDKALADMIADGTLETLGRHYLGSDYDIVGGMNKAINPK